MVGMVLLMPVREIVARLIVLLSSLDELLLLFFFVLVVIVAVVFVVELGYEFWLAVDIGGVARAVEVCVSVLIE